MVHDITQDFDFSNENLIEVDIFNELSKMSATSRIINIVDKDTDLSYGEYEIIYTGTTDERKLKQEYANIINHHKYYCDRCGDVIDVKLWNLGTNDNCISLCQKCDKELEESMNIKQGINKPYNIDKNSISIYETDAREIFIWD